MSIVETEPGEDRTRRNGIVLMGLLSAILMFVLLKTRAPESVQQATPQPAQQAPARQAPDSRAYYRGWPLFQGWPLPDVPQETGNQH